MATFFEADPHQCDFPLFAAVRSTSGGDAQRATFANPLLSLDQATIFAAVPRSKAAARLGRSMKLASYDLVADGADFRRTCSIGKIEQQQHTSHGLFPVTTFS
ncbi:hypothetical protein [Cribrihabitans neustonicus]|uniref:hypothetical protein n=1 Tax=Cribrihabitans neustonicus TaxID=1429085 RepID=UPI003B5B5CF8